MIFIGFQKRARIEKSLEQVPPFLVVSAMVALLFLPVAAAVPATIGIVVLSAVLIACLKKGTNAYKFFTLKKVVFIGVISYSLYLWHWGVLAISRLTIGVTWKTAALQVALMAIAAVGSHRYIESPTRASTWFRERWKTIALGVLVLTIFGIAVNMFSRGLYKIVFLGSKVKFVENVHDKSHSCNIVKDYERAIVFSNMCGTGSDPSDPTIYLLGDSHIDQFSKAFETFGKQGRINIRTVHGNFCLFPSAIVRNSGSDCYARQVLVERSLLKMAKSGDVVVIGNALYASFSPKWDDVATFTEPNGKTLTSDRAAAIYSTKVTSLANTLAAKNIVTVFYLDGVQFPGLKRPGYTCRSEWFRPADTIASECMKDMNDYKLERDRYFEWTRKWEDRRLRFVWDGIENGKCRRGVCTAAEYQDSSHFLPHYANAIFEKFERMHLRPLLRYSLRETERT